MIKDRNDASQSAYRKQRNLCVTLFAKSITKIWWVLVKLCINNLDVLSQARWLKNWVLKIVYNSNESHEELLLPNSGVSIHQKQLGILAADIFKSLADINPDFMK